MNRLTSDLSQAILVGDRILTYRSETLVSIPFDVKTLQVADEVEEIGSHPLYSPSSGTLSVSASKNGDLAFALTSGEGSGQLCWLKRSGEIESNIGHQRLGIQNLAISPGGARFAAQVVRPTGAEIWIGDPEREILTRLTRGGWDATNPVWSPDESRIAFTTQLEGSNSTYIESADGSSPPQVLVTDKTRNFIPTSWSNDGKYLFLESNAKNSTRNEIWLYDFEEKKNKPILSDPSASINAGTLSPDGNWLAYVSDESGNKEVFVRSFPALDRKWQLSKSGGDNPHWRNDGKEVFFVATDLSMQSVAVGVKGNALESGSPVLLFASKLPLMALNPTPDHGRFLAAVVPGDVRSEPIRVILDWKSTASGNQKK